MTSRPIADYALLSDCHSAALVGRDGSIEWLCLPRFDSPSIFARLLDDRAGHWRFGPHDIVDVSRAYRRGSLVLETTFTCARGRGVLVDAFAFGEGERGHDIGIASPHVLLRALTCTEGELDVELDLSPRPRYGEVIPRVSVDGQGADFFFPDGHLRLTSGTGSAVPQTVEPGTHEGSARQRGRLTAGQSWHAALAYHKRGDPPADLPADAIAHRVDDTTRAWQSWADQHQRYAGPWATWSRSAAASCRHSPIVRPAP
jgi:GH15 family glucan-1,4-alpha-glucosidase